MPGTPPADRERASPEVLVLAVRHLLALSPTREEVSAVEIEKVIAIMSVMNRDVMDAERVARLQKDLPFVLDHYWDTLKDKRNRGQRDQIIRGALR